MFVGEAGGADDDRTAGAHSRIEMRLERCRIAEIDQHIAGLGKHRCIVIRSVHSAILVHAPSDARAKLGRCSGDLLAHPAERAQYSDLGHWLNPSPARPGKAMPNIGAIVILAQPRTLAGYLGGRRGYRQVDHDLAGNRLQRSPDLFE